MTLDKTPENIHNMFNTIAEKYDFMNDVISLGLHKTVKYLSVKNLDIHPHDRVLDLCCGTGDLSRDIKQKQPLACVTGIDFSENMLKIAKRKSNDIKLVQGDVSMLPFDDNTFDFITMGFGLRNIYQPEKAIEEAYRVLRPGGQFLHLDFGEKGFADKIFDIGVPFLTKIFYGGNVSYDYLVESKKVFPKPDELIKDFESKGFKFVKRKDYIFGVISCQILKK